MPLDYVGILLRWLHILAGATAVGGAVLMRLAVWPALDALPGEARKAFLEAVRARWAMITHAAITLLLVTGLVNFLRLRDMFPSGSSPSVLYNMLFGIKFLAALAVFGIASMLVGRSPVAEKFRGKASMWLSVNLALLILIVCLSGVMSRMHTAANPELIEKELMNAE